MKFAAAYGITVGSLILAQWIFFLATGNVPEFRTEPWSIGFHLAAELTLSLTLICGGIAAWQSRRWGPKLLLLALGMAIYSEINSPGYFVQQGNWALVGMFALLLAGAVVGLSLVNTRACE